MKKKLSRRTKTGNITKPITSGGLFNQPAGGNTIILTQARRWQVDISHYMRAVTEAERIDFPNRARLYDLYDTILLDTHLSSVLEKRKSAVLSSQIEFSRDGKPDKAIGEMLESPWFLDFLSDLLDTAWWGGSLFQFGIDEGGWLSYDLIPRKHVDPIRKLILRMQTDIHGTAWDEYDNLLFVGKPRALGELIKDIPWVLYKRADVSDWAQFAELFGQPIREYTYNGNDDQERYNLMQDAHEAGGSSVYIHPDGTGLKLLEAGNKSGSSDLYKNLAAFCNSEISKHVLGNTLTTEAGEKGTQALGEVHKKIEDKLLAQDKLFVLNVLNYQMTDIFESFGINVKGGKFSFVIPKDSNQTQRIDIITKLSSLGLPISHDQLYDEFGLNKPDNYNEITAEREREKDDTKIRLKEKGAGKKEETKGTEHNSGNVSPAPKRAVKGKMIRTFFKNLTSRFFGKAPKSKGALGW